MVNDDAEDNVTTPDDWVPLAEVARPHGVRGELRLKIFNEDSDVLVDAARVHLKKKSGEEVDFHVERARRAVDAVLVKLRGLDDRDRADELRGALVCLRRRDFPELDEGEFYVCDVVGAEVVFAGDAPGAGEEGARGAPGERRLGIVRRLDSYPTVDTLIVAADDGGKDWEVPLVEAVVERVDVGAKRVALRTLEGVERA